MRENREALLLVNEILARNGIIDRKTYESMAAAIRKKSS